MSYIIIFSNIMLLKQQYEPSEVYREAEAFCATCIIFKIKLGDLALASGLDRLTIDRFYRGEGEMSTLVLFKILKVLTPNERNFYNSLMTIQDAAADAGVAMPLLDFASSAKSDVYRDALDLTLKIFGVQQKDVYTPAGMQSSNFSAWFTGKREINLGSLAKIKAALSREQRAFFDSVANILISLEPSPPEIRIKSIG